ncbi:uncharacterized protein LOC130625800 [Hydractinia symbiolongicarpus]|uniref:uncharacterized protein LOC130625800 n=1 Tax=Hydractinia symbiolongicarpus TaxID=13093 RepID=UPI00254D6AD7|nr:uncharacterized protein LOC130625800 [Hydractinia symbiolongicarpus]
MATVIIIVCSAGAISVVLLIIVVALIIKIRKKLAALSSSQLTELITHSTSSERINVPEVQESNRREGKETKDRNNAAGKTANFERDDGIYEHRNIKNDMGIKVCSKPSHYEKTCNKETIDSRNMSAPIKPERTYAEPDIFNRLDKNEASSRTYYNTSILHTMEDTDDNIKTIRNGNIYYLPPDKKQNTLPEYAAINKTGELPAPFPTQDITEEDTSTPKTDNMTSIKIYEEI